jgi:ATP/maltotriose-dependent transcriptional regulator MalT
VLDDARAEARWEEAFELATQSRDLSTAAEILGDAGSELLAEGRVETVEGWFDLCGPAALENPSAALVYAEALIWRGRLAEAAALARDLAERLPAEDSRTSRAWYLAGQAKYLLSDYENAIDFHGRSRASAIDNASLKDALWGLFLTATELESDSAGGYLSQLEAEGDRTLEDRLRLATARTTRGCHIGSLANVWSEVESLLPYSQHVANPMVRSSFLAHAAYAAVSRGDYKNGQHLAKCALRYCRDLALVFAQGFCLLQEAKAEIGLRDFRGGRKRLAELSALLKEHEQPSLAIEQDALALRLTLAETGSVSTLDDLLIWPSDDLPRASYGEFLSLVAIAAASASRHRLAATLRRQASRTTQGIEATYFLRFAELILRAKKQTSAKALTSHANALLQSAAKDEFLDGAVVAYRAYPELLEIFANEPSGVRILRRLMPMANDQALARAAGIPVRRLDQPEGLGMLTPRENEVLRLIVDGLTNLEISKRLFITQGTTKVHVHSILTKLEVRNRLQAILRFQELNDDPHLGRG